MNVAVAAEPRYTPEDLLAMPDGKDYELVGGHLVERKMGAESSWVGGLIYHYLLVFVREHGLGWVWPPDNGFQCFPDDPRKVRRPDVSFIRQGRLPGERLPVGWIGIPPDLVVEVISPNDLASEINQKVRDYFRAGVALVWVVDPEAREVHVRRPNGADSTLQETDEFSGEDVLPAFRLRVGAIFPAIATKQP